LVMYPFKFITLIYYDTKSLIKIFPLAVSSLKLLKLKNACFCNNLTGISSSENLKIDM